MNDAMNLVKAINALAEGANFKFENADLETLIWLSNDIKKPLDKDILAKLAELNS